MEALEISSDRLQLSELKSTMGTVSNQSRSQFQNSSQASPWLLAFIC